MEVVVLDDAVQRAELVVAVITDLLRRTADPVLGLATGSSPLSVYDALAAAHARGEVSLQRASAFLLDEYLGLPPGHPQSYREVIGRELVSRVDLDPARVHGPDGHATDVAGACVAYEQAIAAAGGIDVQLLGIGRDGHLAFNEPGSSLASRTRVKTLTAQTRADNARFFGSVGDVPRHVITQGLGTILQARHLVLLAEGAAKAGAVAACVEGPVTASWPASVLQLHPHVTVLLDGAAAGRLQRLDYYREVWAGKPAWQRL
ncbi:glucosamine-6-phosphate deaminase [Angustibacter sp. Root456]|uniref:glucosamine-6-phosphate deaminase n=1 Tax=Angustibacter sp. Root456 TaxID=1736539 RepID=UPI0006F693E3|nr:glucosamine-6-phosphate deaminase [Angustibacter sp. Root456]KQX68588.1 glucosamine-6-phosphate deaminase [Angustibacter sp. Root456]